MVDSSCTPGDDSGQCCCRCVYRCELQERLRNDNRGNVKVIGFVCVQFAEAGRIALEIGFEHSVGCETFTETVMAPLGEGECEGRSPLTQSGPNPALSPSDESNVQPKGQE